MKRYRHSDFISIFGWGAVHDFPEAFAVVAETVEPCLQCNIADGLIGVYQQFTASFYAVLVEIGKWCLLHLTAEKTGTLSFT